MDRYLMATYHFDKGTLGDAGRRSQTGLGSNSAGAWKKMPSQHPRIGSLTVNGRR